MEGARVRIERGMGNRDHMDTAPVTSMEESSRPPLGRAFLALVTSSGASNLADGVLKVVLPLAAVRVTQSPGLVAGVLIASGLPWLLFALHAGAFVDRMDRRRVMIGANLTRATLVAIPAVTFATGSGSIGWLYVAAFGIGMAEVMHDTAAQSLIPAIIPRDSLSRANGRLFAVELSANQFVGPPFGGFLVAASVAIAFLVPSMLWMAAVGAVLFVRGNFRPERTGGRSTVGADIGEGLRFVFRHRTLRRLALITGVFNLASTAAFAVIALYAVGESSAMGLTDPQFGVLIATLAVGSVLATFVIDRIERRIGRAWCIRTGLVGMTGLVAMPAVTTNVALIGSAMFVGGFTMILWNVPAVSFRQSVTPNHLLGRMTSAYRLVAWGSMPIGAAAGGIIGEAFGLRAVFASAGVLALSQVIPAMRITNDELNSSEVADDVMSASRPASSAT